MIYNNPVSYGVDVQPEAFLRLADSPRGPVPCGWWR
jgi:dihydrodipicolinate synthase/N-acetylneuraminate lyase